MATLYFTVWKDSKEVLLGPVEQEGTVTVGTTSVQGSVITGLGVRTRRVRVICTANVFVTWGTNPTAASDGTSGRFQPKDTSEYYEVVSGQRLAAILADPSDIDLLEVAKGNVAGHRLFVIPGRKNSVSATVLDDITQIPSTTVVPNPGGIQMEVVSSSASDVSGGAGVDTVDLHYLDTSGVEQEETITMSGQTPVNTVATDIDKVQWMHTMTLDGATVAAGNISLRDTAGAVTYEYIAAGGNQSLSGRFHIPTAKKGYIVGWKCSAITKQIDFRLRATCERFDRSLLPGVFLFQDTEVLNNAPSGWIPIPFSQVPATATIKISGISAASGGNAGASFTVLVVDD